MRDWQGAVLEMVRLEGGDRRATARFLAYGVNGLGVALMIVIFASTAGLTGAEVGVAGGTAIVGQKILEAVFGDQAVRRLAETARADLHARVEELCSTGSVAVPRRARRVSRSRQAPPDRLRRLVA